MENKYGFVPDALITKDNYVMGASELPRVVIQPDGDWTPYLPEDEIQQKYGVETHNCTAFGWTNLIEMVLKKLGYDHNYSDRALGIMAGTYPPGNTPHKVGETIRKKGLVYEAVLPFSDSVNTVDDYYDKSLVTDTVSNEAKKWLYFVEFGHEWVFTPEHDPAEQRERIKEALTYSPLGVSVYAWVKSGDSYVKPSGTRDNHWCTLVNVEDDGRYKIFDSYDNTTKYLHKDFTFDWCKRVHLLNVNFEREKEDLKDMEEVVSFLDKYVFSIFRKLYTVLKQLFGIM